MGELQTVGKARAHTLMLDKRSHAVITGVMDVSSFHETEIILKVEGGLMVIGGQGLHVGKLLLEEGRLDVEGRIDSVVYEAPRSAGRLFGLRRRG